MKISKALISLLLITAIYVGALLILDIKNNIFADLRELLNLLPVLCLAAFFSWTIRYTRWHYLLTRAGFDVPRRRGFLSYIAGFAFTASPGKVGELLRIRYFSQYAVPAKTVISAFIYERAFDLLIVLALSIFIALHTHFFWLAVAFVVGLLMCLGIIVSCTEWLLKLNKAKLYQTILHGVADAKQWLTLKDILISGLLGLAAWLIVALSFVWMLLQLGIAVPFFEATAIYPLSMLVGAASALPGGIGSTEVTIVALLSLYDAVLPLAILAAVAIRLGTLWSAVVCGVIAMVLLEFRHISTTSKNTEVNF